MSWTSEFAAELRARGVGARARERLVAELADHITCEPDSEARLGAPAQIAGQYADELASEQARRGALGTFAALVCAATAFFVETVSLGQSTGYPGFRHGFSGALAVVAIFALLLGSQVALVCGSLAAWRAVRRRHATVMPAAEVALIRRRATIALAAGLTATVGLMIYALNFLAVESAWWLAVSLTLAGSASAAVLLAWRALRRSGATLALAAGPPGDVFDAVPPLRWLRPHPLVLCALSALAVGTVVMLGEWRAEHSLAEGFERGGFEALALTACFALFGRAIGARR